MPVSPTGYTVEALALNVTILQMVLGLVGFIVAVLGFFGYAGIKEGAKDVAEREARKVANDQMIKFRKEMAQIDKSGQTESPGDYAADADGIENAEPAQGE